MSINKRITLFISIMVIGSMILVGLVSNWLLNKTLLNSALNYLNTAAYTAKSLLDKRLDEMQNGSLFSVDFSDVAQRIQMGDAPYLEEVLQDLKSTFSYVSVGIFMDADGRQLACLDENADGASELFLSYMQRAKTVAKPLAVQGLLPLDPLYSKDSGNVERYQVKPADQDTYLNDGLFNIVVHPVSGQQGVAGYLILAEIINYSDFYPEEYKKTISNSNMSLSIHDVRVCTNLTSDSEASYVGSSIPQFPRDYQKGEPYFGSEYAPIGDNYFFLYEPIFDLWDTPIGFISVGVPEYTFMNMLDMNRLGIAMVVVASLPVILLFCYFFSRRIAKPILSCVGIAKCISRGDFSAAEAYPMPPHSDNETDLLLESIKEMAKTLETNRDSIESYVSELHERHEEARSLSRQLIQMNENLESMVDARTMELRQTVEALNESNKVKANFLANMSHELKTPLSCNISASQLLLDEIFGTLNEKQTKYVENIWSSSSHLLQLINDILDISKIEAGKTELNLGVYSVWDIFQESISVIKSMAYEKSIQFHLEVTPPELMVTADRKLIKQILYNLLSNAVKFSHEESGIYLDARVDSLPETGKQAVRFSIRDTGIGIAEEDQERVFFEFEQVDNSYARQYGGTGLGLPLSRQQVELHGGRLFLSSRLGEGTEIVFYIPLVESLLQQSGIKGGTRTNGPDFGSGR